MSTKFEITIRDRFSICSKQGKWSWRESSTSNLMADYQFVANILNGQSHAKSNELLFSKVVSYCECKDMKNDENIEEN